MKFNQLKIIVVDDEDDIRKTLVNTINESIEMNVIGEADSIKSAYELISSNGADAIFLDIKIKGGDAFQLLRSLQRNKIKIPPVIINTGFAEFEYVQKAHNEFGESVIMILKKPFWENWTDTESLIVEKIYQKRNSQKKPSRPKQNISVRQDDSTWLINLDHIVFIESDKSKKGRGHAILYTKEKEYRTSQSLSKIESQLPIWFVRVSRYAVVNSKYIERYLHLDQCIFVRGFDQYIGVGDAFKSELLKLLKMK